MLLSGACALLLPHNPTLTLLVASLFFCCLGLDEPAPIRTVQQTDIMNMGTESQYPSKQAGSAHSSLSSSSSSSFSVSSSESSFFLFFFFFELLSSSSESFRFFV